MKKEERENGAKIKGDYSNEGSNYKKKASRGGCGGLQDGFNSNKENTMHETDKGRNRGQQLTKQKG